MTHSQVVAQVREILDQRCAEPAAEIEAMGHALVKIGQALKGLSLAESRAILVAVDQLSQVDRPRQKDGDA